LVFGRGLDLAISYAGWLAGPAIDWGLLGPREADRLWTRHLLNCAGLADLIPTGAHVVDLGSGAGLPGLVLAIVRPELRVSLVEPLARRCRFLRACLAGLTSAGSAGKPLAAVEIYQQRAEELTGTLSADVVVARAVAPLDRLVPLALPLIRPGGRLIAMKGASAKRELDVFRASRPARRVRGVTVTTCGIPPATATVVTMTVPARKRNHQR
jgi:16S rRNA (guanine527-N7)-methyltransferase